MHNAEFVTSIQFRHKVRCKQKHGQEGFWYPASLKAKTKIKALIEIVSNASEFANLPIRYKEDLTLKKLADRLGTQMKSQKWLNPHVKVSHPE